MLWFTGAFRTAVPVNVPRRLCHGNYVITVILDYPVTRVCTNNVNAVFYLGVLGFIILQAAAGPH